MRDLINNIEYTRYFIEKSLENNFYIIMYVEEEFICEYREGMLENIKDILLINDCIETELVYTDELGVSISSGDIYYQEDYKGFIDEVIEDDNSNIELIFSISDNYINNNKIESFHVPFYMRLALK